jgi:hypothetical protein
MILFTKKKKSTLNFSINNYSSKSDRDRIVMSNIANVASNWIIIFTLSLTIKLDASSLIAGYRYLDFAYAAACIFPQSQHGRLAKSKNQYLRRRSHQISFIITFIIITVSVLSFGLINQILFQNLIVLSHIQLLIIFSYLIVRIFLLLLTQDYLMNEGEDRIASNLNLIFAFASASSAFVASNILHNIDTLPLLNVILGILIITFMLMFSRYTRIMFREIFGWRL